MTTAPFAIRLLATAAALLAGGCSTLPSSGPTARQVLAAERRNADQINLRVVDIDPAVVAAQSDARGAPALAALARDGRVDTIGPGDVLEISVFETGTPLFSGGATALGQIGGGDAFNPSARRAPLSGLMVDQDGVIALPYIGRLQVAGRTPSEVQRMIETSLSGKSQSPQVIVSVRENLANTVFVMGEARKPGRFPLSGARERLLDAIATAGGSELEPEDILVRFSRGDRAAEEPLADIESGSPADLTLLAGDRIQLLKRRRSFTVFGATGKVSQQPFEATRLSLAEAVARVGGPADNQADPSAVFLFRYEGAQTPQAGDLPTIYRLNLMKPSHYFLAQRFPMRDKDVIYIANASANQASKLVQIVNQLFAPIFSVGILINSRN